MKLGYDLSIDIGSASIKILYGRNFLGHINLRADGVIVLQRGVFSNGYIYDEEKLSVLIKEFIADNCISSRYISFVVHSKEIITRNLTIPRMGYKELDKMIAWEMGQFVKSSMDEYRLSYEIIEKDKEKYGILAVIIPKRMVRGYMRLAELLNMKIRYIDIASKCILRLIKKAEESAAVIDLGNESVRMCIFDSCKLYIEKELSLGLNNSNFFKEGSIYENNGTDLPERLKQFQRIIEYSLGNSDGVKEYKTFFIGGGSLIKDYKDIASIYFPVEASQGSILGNRYGGLSHRFGEKINIYANCLGLLIRK